MEDDEHREKLKSSGKHIKDHYELGGLAPEGEIPCGTHKVKAGTDIVYGCGYGREIGFKVMSFKGNGKDRGRKDDHKSSKINMDGTDRVGIDGFAVHF